MLDVAMAGDFEVLGILGDPIRQAKSPEILNREFRRLRIPAVLVPFHVLPTSFEDVVSSLMAIQNVRGLMFTVPYKVRGVQFTDVLGPQALIIGAINSLSRNKDGRWIGEAFDGIGCVEAFRRQSINLRGKRVMLIGCGGAGTSIAVSLAYEGVKNIRLFDPNEKHAEIVARKVTEVDKSISIEIGYPLIKERDILINASPVGMLDDKRLPIDFDELPKSVAVLDAVPDPMNTPLVRLAKSSNCIALTGRDMIEGQVDHLVKFFGFGNQSVQYH